MSRAHEAFIASPHAALALFRSAFAFEYDAFLVWNQETGGSEPTRSVLCRSAASLALRAGHLDACESLLRDLRAGPMPAWMSLEADQLTSALADAKRLEQERQALMQSAVDIAGLLLSGDPSALKETAAKLYESAVSWTKHATLEAAVVHAVTSLVLGDDESVSAVELGLAAELAALQDGGSTEEARFSERFAFAGDICELDDELV